MKNEISVWICQQAGKQKYRLLQMFGAGEVYNQGDLPGEWSVATPSCAILG